MKNKFFIICSVFLAIACLSCNKDDDNNPTDPTNPTNPSDFDTYTEIEAYCLENGWTECSLINTIGGYNYIQNRDERFNLYFSNNGTLSQASDGNGADHARYKLVSSFNDLLELDTPPVDGYISSFTCDNEKFGVCKNYTYTISSSYQFTGYSKFYIRRIDQETIKIFFKRCGWPTEE